MKKTIIKSIIAVICTAAICASVFFCFSSYKKTVLESKTAPGAYMTENEAAEYIGIPASKLAIIRSNLKYLEGAYIEYTYTQDGKEVTVIMYSKDKLDDAVEKLMAKKETKNINLKYLEQALKEAEGK